MSPFKTKVIEIIQFVPFGKVVSYGQVALYAGFPRAARQVGWILHSTEGNVSLPWWRVINNEGRITIKGSMYNTRDIQRKLLISEGIEVEKDFTLDIEKYRFIADQRLLQTLALPDTYIKKLMVKYGI